MGSKTASLGLACALAFLAASAPAAMAADRAAAGVVQHERVFINLSVHFTEIVRLDRPASTIVIGNPGIADATLGDEHSLILAGRAAGATNVVVLDAAGDEIASLVLRVLAGPPSVTTFFYGTERRTYSCDRRCESVLSVGDGKDYFETTEEQIGARQEFSEPVTAQ